jgi:glucose-1-phosphate adenylyltransferase
MDPRQMLDFHLENEADVTVAGIPVPIEDGSSYGIIEAGSDNRIANFHEKPENPPAMPSDPTRAFASMGNYIFSTEALEWAVKADSKTAGSKHDMGGDIIPLLTGNGSAFVYDFADNDAPGQHEAERGYWRDVGTIDSYYDASMDLVGVQPTFNFYNYEWSILTWNFPDPPAKFVFDEGERRGYATDSIVANGTIVSGGVVKRSIVSPRVRINSYSEITDSVILSDVDVGRGAVTAVPSLINTSRSRRGTRSGWIRFSTPSVSPCPREAS